VSDVQDLLRAMVEVQSRADKWLAPVPAMVLNQMRGDLQDGARQLQNMENRRAHREGCYEHLIEAIRTAREAADGIDAATIAALDRLGQFLDLLPQPKALGEGALRTEFEGVIKVLTRERMRIADWGGAKAPPPKGLGTQQGQPPFFPPIPNSMPVGHTKEASSDGPGLAHGLWVDDKGSLVMRGAVPLSTCLHTLAGHLRLFMIRLESCERTKANDYRLWDTSVGSMEGARVLWDNICNLAMMCVVFTLPPESSEERVYRERGVPRLAAVNPIRNARPLAEVLLQLKAAIPFRTEDGRIEDVIPAATVARIRMLAAELELHRPMWKELVDGQMKAGDPPIPPEGIEPPIPSLKPSALLVLETMARFDPMVLLSAESIAKEMGPSKRLSPRTIGPIVSKLITLDLAERPEGKNSGARLKLSGRRIASKIAE